MDKISGKINQIIYKNPSNHYTVMDVDMDGELISATGIIVSASVGEKITATGEWYIHPNYGEQFKIMDIAIEAPTDIESIRSYLASGMLTGIGEKKADELIRHFGSDILYVIENEPQKLVSVKGIGKKTAENIHQSYMQQYEERNVIMAMSKFGLTTAASMKLYKRYGGNVVQLISRNPYRLIEDVYGIGFVKADTIAMKAGIDPDSPIRISAAIRYYIGLFVQKGYTYVPEDMLLHEVSRALGLNRELIEDEITSLYQSGKTILDDAFEQRRCYLQYMYECETYCAEKIISLSEKKGVKNEFDILAYIDKYQRYTNIQLDEIQKKAIYSAVSERITVITGGPGTGKTTIIKAIIYILSQTGKKFALCAPTGRASKRLSEACGYEAKTIHRLLEYGYNPYDSGYENYDENSMLFNRDEDNPLEQDTVIVDEMSMVDLPLMYHLLNAVSENASLILVGDADQLPSVGPGSVLLDMVESKIINVVKLETIFRQASESLIITNAHKINNGQEPVFNNNKDEFIFLEAVTQQRIATKILSILKEDQYRSLQLLKNDKLQIVSPFRNGEAGIINLNNKIQQLVNPPDSNKNETNIPYYTLRDGDKVMQTKNNYNIQWKNTVTYQTGEGVFNGDMGYVERIDKAKRQVSVLFDYERLVIYSFTELECLTLAYAITIHKSQGSEFNTMIIPVFGGNPEFLSRNLIYTAITRAEKQVILVGERRILSAMIQNNRIQKRLCALKERLMNHVGH